MTLKIAQPAYKTHQKSTRARLVKFANVIPDIGEVRDNFDVAFYAMSVKVEVPRQTEYPAQKTRNQSYQIEDNYAFANQDGLEQIAAIGIPPPKTVILSAKTINALLVLLLINDQIVLPTRRENLGSAPEIKVGKEKSEI